MQCRVGITTDPYERKRYWEKNVIGLHDWVILTSCANKAQAQMYESIFARNHGCESSPGGADAEGKWYVYHFRFTIRNRTEEEWPI